MSARRILLKSICLRLAMNGLLAGLIGSLAGCRSGTIKDVERAPIPPTASEAQVKAAILEAGASLGWSMKAKRPGLIIGILSLRSHMAEVEIPYSRTSYSILYKSSSNLDYDPTKRTIHSNYNGWVQNLDGAIRARLALL